MSPASGPIIRPGADSSAPRKLPLFAGLVAGGLSGLGGSAVAHWLVTLLNHAANADLWLKGSFGPPFFNISLFMGVMYGLIGLGLSRRAGGLLLGFLGPFLGIALPMAVFTHVASGWEAAGLWYYAVVGLFVLAVWGTIFALGFCLSARRWLGGLSCIGTAYAAYRILTAMLWAAPGLARWPWAVGGLLPQPTVLLDGLLTGSGMGIGLWLASGRKENA